MKRFFTKVLWSLGLIVLGALLALFIASRFSGDTEKTTNTTNTITRLEQVQEHIFLNVGINTIETIEHENEFLKKLNLNFPITQKRALVIVNYMAKFGFNKPVTITELSENTYRITVPAFVSLGVELDETNPYQLYSMDEGLLSFATEDIDTAEYVSERLSNAEQQTYLAQYQQELKESCERYFASIFEAIDPAITLEFQYQ